MKTLTIDIRKAEVRDAAAIADVHQEAWRGAYSGVIPHRALNRMINRRGPEWWANALRSGDSTFVLEVGGEVAGYATWGSARSRGAYQGEIYEIYLAPSYQGLGFGELLFEACRHALDERRVKGLICWALSENTPAIDFYWRRGGRPIAKAFDRIGGAKLEKVAFAWS